MHGERMNYNNVILAIDETDMDNDNENNISGNNYAGIVTGPGGNTIAYNPDFEVNNSSIDLDMYVSGFTGLMRINRLLFLAEHCPLLRLDGLRLALNYVMETFNTQLYISIHKQLSDAFSRL
jgi:hypothetical protein